MLLNFSRSVHKTKRWQERHCFIVYRSIMTPLGRNDLLNWLDDQDFFVHMYDGWTDEFFFERIEDFTLTKLALPDCEFIIPYSQHPRFDEAMAGIRETAYNQCGGLYEALVKSEYYDEIKLTPYLQSRILGK